MASSLLGVFRWVVSLYFREVEVVGDVPSATTGGRIFGANHFNGLVDPILVLTNAPCPIAPVAKSTLWKVPVLRALLDAVGAVPVARRKDDPNKPAEANEEVFARVASHLGGGGKDRKSTRLNSSHSQISYAVFCLKQKNRTWHHHHASPRRLTSWHRLPVRRILTG